MGYLIDRLRSKIDFERVTPEEVEWHIAEFEEYSFEKNSVELTVRKLENKDAISECIYRTVHSNSGSVEETPFPMYSEFGSSREYDLEKIAYYLNELYGEGIYRIRFSDGRGFKIIKNHIFVTGREKWQK